METSGIRRLASEKTLFFLTASIMILMPVSELITQIWWNFDPLMQTSLYQPMVLGAYGFVGTVTVVIYKCLELTDKTNRDKWYPVDVFYPLLILFMVLSAVFSVNPGMYCKGDIFMAETPMSFLAYFSLFFAGSRIRSHFYRKRLIVILLMIAVLQSVIAFFHTFDIEIAYSLPVRHSGAAYGLTQNSNFYGGLSVFLLACVSGVFLFSEKFTKNRIIRYGIPVFAGFLFYTMMGSRARLAWTGFAAMIVFYVVSGAVMLKGNISRVDLKRYFMRLAALAAVFAAVFAITYFFTDYVSEEIYRTTMEVEGIYDSGIGSDRLLLWKCGLERVPYHWVTGIGLDNFREVFYEKYGNVEMPFYRDKAHNEYIQTLVNQGVFAFALYLFIYLRTAVINVKKIFTGDDETERSLNWILLGMFVTYAVQSFFNISVINVALYFWLVMGLLNACDSPLRLSLNKNI